MYLPFKKNHTSIRQVNNERGVMGLILVIILILGIALGVYLVQTRTNLFPKAFQSLSGPSEPLPLDSDGDGFSDNQEVFMGTNPNKGCPSTTSDNAWPVDINNDKSVNGADTSTLVPYINGSQAYNRRYDLNQDGKISGTTNPFTDDVAVIQSNMLKTCGGGITPSASPTTLNSKLIIFKGVTPTNIGEENSFEIHVSSPTDLVNLVSAQLSFTKDQVEVTGIEINKSVFKQEIEKFFDNNSGQISIVTGMASTGIKDSLNAPTTKVAEVKFRVKGMGVGKTSFTTDSKVMRSSDNTNILDASVLPVYTLTNAIASPNPTPGIPVSCKPKPDIVRTSQMTAQGLKVTISSSTNNTTPTNRIKVVSFHRFENATVTIGNQFFKAPFTYNVPSNENSVTFLINQATLNQSTLVELKAGDVCGETSLFFGGGTQAGWPTVIPSPPGTIAGSPVPSTPCTLTKSEWVITSNPVNSNTTAELRVEASGACTGQQVSFVVFEDDGVLGTDPVKQNPSSVILIPNAAQNNFTAKTTWVTEFQEDGVFGSNYPPEFKFTARLVAGGGARDSINPQLQVLRQAGQPSPEVGDVNGKGGTNLDDISWMLSNWGPINNEFADYNKDKIINNFDIQHLVGVLKQKGILRK